MTKKIVDKPYTMDIHGNIKYPEPSKPEVTAAHEEPVTDVSIDSLMLRGLSIIDRVMRACMQDASTGAPSRESVQNLKDSMSMLKDLKAQETDLLTKLSDDEIKKKITE